LAWRQTCKKKQLMAGKAEKSRIRLTGEVENRYGAGQGPPSRVNYHTRAVRLCLVEPWYEFSFLTRGSVRYGLGNESVTDNVEARQTDVQADGFQG